MTYLFMYAWFADINTQVSVPMFKVCMRQIWTNICDEFARSQVRKTKKYTFFSLCQRSVNRVGIDYNYESLGFGELIDTKEVLAHENIVF